MKIATGVLPTPRFAWTAIMGSLVFCSLVVSPAQAQEFPDDEEEALETIIVTGSRIKRDSTFTSTSPLAVIDAEESFQFGAIDSASLLRQSTSVSGQQIDSSFSGFTVDGGPGAETIALRGLGPERTLVLMDGRRIGAAGNFGAAVFPDLSLIPSFLINRAEILLSGASSIYGADAVAGVVNIITPTDFEGVQFDATFSSPNDSGGEESLVSLQFGGNTDRMRFYLGAEYFHREGVRARDRDFTAPGQRNIEIDDAGVVTTEPDGFFDQTVAFTPDCFFSGYTPGQQSGGSLVPDWSCDVDFSESPWEKSTMYLPQHIWSPTEKWAGFASVEYDLEVMGDSAFFFQFLTSNRRQRAHGGDGQFFPNVPAINMFNPWGDPAINPGQGPVVAVAFDQDSRSDTDDTSVNYERYVTGLRGDMPFMDVGSMSNWTYEVSVGYTRSTGSNNFDIIRNDRFTNSINNCPNTNQDLFGSEAPPCVVVNLFGPDFIENGSFGDARDYLVARVTNNTKVTQTAYEAGATGDLFELPAGPVGVFLGASYREDTILSDVDRNIEESNAWGRSAEGDTIGEVTIEEIYTEIDVPILSGRTMAEDVGINVSYRISDHEFFGSEDTWRVTAHWDFTEWLRLRGTTGTSFRAPNIKELFIADQTGFEGAFIDPCIPPTVEDRSQTIIDNCISEGVDPFALGSTGAPSVPIVSGGNRELRPETSDSWSIGAVFSQPWTDAFEFQVSVDLTNLDIKDAVAEPSAGFILNECYTSPGFSDPLCDRVTRNLAAAPDQRFLSEVDESVANIELENYEDLSFSFIFSKDFDIGNRFASFVWNADFTKTLEYERGLFVETADELVGSIGVPEWRIQSSLSLAFESWSFSHHWNFFSDGQDTAEQQQSGGYGDGFVNFIGDYTAHTFSVAYDADNWRAFLTLENAFDDGPDLIHEQAFVNNEINNMPIGVYPSYAIMGRAMILGVSAGF